MSQPFVESLIEGIPLRGYVRETMEVKSLRRASEVGKIDRGLHIACGNGESTRLILKHFSIESLSAVDRDSEAIGAARTRTDLGAIDFSVQEVSSLGFADGEFDAVFDLAELHNLADWRRGLAELRRVLKPGGLLFVEELSRETFAHAAGRLFKALTVHPYDLMLTREGLREALLEEGFEILHFEERNPLGLLRYLIVVARRSVEGRRTADGGAAP